MLSTIAVILVLGGLIFFHELGHFAVARLFGIGVSTFSLGFGKKLFTRTYGKTEYCLSLVPLGGYVSLVGEDDDADMPDGFTSAENFSRRPPWQRLLVVAAGPVANIVLAWILCWGLAFHYGQTHVLAHIGTLEEGGPAQTAGIMVGDTVLAINGQPVDDWAAMSAAIGASQGASLRIEIARAGRSSTITVTPTEAVRKTIFGEDERTWRIGVRASGQTATAELGFWDSAGAGLQRTGEMLHLTWTGIVKLVQRVVPLDQVGGPIMIAQMVGQQAQAGLAQLLALTAFISINLAVLNLLPIPVLDGGHIVFYTLETLMRRPLSRRIRLVTTQVGFALLITLMVFATFNDVWRLVKGIGGFGG